MKNNPEDVKKYKELLDYAVSKGVMVELNEKSIINMPKEISKFVRSLKCTYVLGSDAHEYHSIGKFGNCIDYLNTYLPNAKVVNFDRDWLEDLRATKPNKESRKFWSDILEDYKKKYSE